MERAAGEIAIPESLMPALIDFCRRWKITELSLFGSALGQEFSEGSDVDLLVTFAEDASWSLLNHVAMQRELEAILGRAVDLVSRRAVQNSANHLRRREILEHARAIYAAPETAHGS